MVTFCSNSKLGRSMSNRHIAVVNAANSQDDQDDDE